MVNVITRLEREYQSNFTSISSEFITINATIQVLVSNMVRHNVDGILAQRTQSVSDESDQANQLEASSQSMQALLPEVRHPIHLFLKMLRPVLRKFLIRLKGIILLTIC